MGKFNDLENCTVKELRKLRMNRNNRLESYNRDESPKDLAKSHKLHGMSRLECEELLIRVKQVEKNLSHVKDL